MSKINESKNKEAETKEVNAPFSIEQFSSGLRVQSAFDEFFIFRKM